jgi:hypothetical protein
MIMSADAKNEQFNPDPLYTSPYGALVKSSQELRHDFWQTLARQSPEELHRTVQLRARLENALRRLHALPLPERVELLEGALKAKDD